MSIAIAVFNRKGGVGKSSLSKDLAFALGQEGVEVCLLDLDPQASLSVMAGMGTDTAPDRTIARLLLPDLEEFRDTPIGGAVHTAPWGGTIVPASGALTLVERELSRPDRAGSAKRLAVAIRRLGDDGHHPDVVLMDCPPAVGTLSLNALVAARWVLVPTGLEWVEIAGLAALMRTVTEVREYEQPDLDYLAIVGTRVRARTRHAREIGEQLKQMFGKEGLLASQSIRATVRVADAHANHRAVGQLYPSAAVSQDYRELAREVMERAGIARKAPSA